MISPSGHKKVMPFQIASEFQEYYSSLYNLPRQHTSESDMRDYLSQSDIPKLWEETGAALEEPITLVELQSAIKGIKPGKVPGSDSFTLQYYWALFSVISPYMVKVFNNLAEEDNFREIPCFPHSERG